jgi:predicted nucleotidyltransferase
VTAGNEERLYGEEISMFEAIGYNLDLASPRLLGKDVGRVITAETRDRILALLDDAVTGERLLGHMARAFRGADDSIGEAEAFLREFRIGLQGSSGSPDFRS